ncbi:hypothetical protein Mapa_006132 [Marchantia paleacea]|nr:hypothetical protein Mapa_006132 [Marchantia paleacea]
MSKGIDSSQARVRLQAQKSGLKDESTECSDNAPSSSESSDFCFPSEKEQSPSTYCLDQNRPNSTTTAGSIFEFPYRPTTKSNQNYITSPETHLGSFLNPSELSISTYPENKRLPLGQKSSCTESPISERFVRSLRSPTRGQHSDAESNPSPRTTRHLHGAQMKSFKRWNSLGDGRLPVSFHESSNVGKVLQALKSAKKVILKFTRTRSRTSNPKDYRRKVVVNGVKIRDDCVRKAESQAGPIHPGKYWYDSRAGFWGAAGGPCLGIIPPFIEELDYPMAADCAGGSTGITVNGRELHHMDLQKLVSRGFPSVPGMAYRVDIDGRFVELSSGAELRGLGHLAPSLKQKRGSGMYQSLSL